MTAPITKKHQANQAAIIPTTASTTLQVVHWDDHQLRLLKEQIAPKATDAELALFGQVCQRTGLDPFLKQIYAIHRWDSQSNGHKMTIQTSIDGYRLIADRTRQYSGSETFWCGSDGVWVDVWLKKENPAAAKVVVYKKGGDRGFSAVARWDSYVQTKKDGTPSQKWRDMPDVMLAKCAEALALRKAFPAELSGLSAVEERAESPINPEPSWDFLKSELWYNLQTAFHNLRDATQLPAYEAKARGYIASGELPLHAGSAIDGLVETASERLVDALGYHNDQIVAGTEAIAPQEF